MAPQLSSRELVRSVRCRLLCVVTLCAGLTAGCSPSVFDLAVGDCFSFPPGTSLDTPNDLTSVTIRHCSEPHDAEVIGSYTIPGDDHAPYPDYSTLYQQAQQSCELQFNDYVGMPDTQSVLDMAPLLPTDDSWTRSGDRTALCVAFSRDEKVSSSFHQFGR